MQVIPRDGWQAADVAMPELLVPADPNLIQYLVVHLSEAPTIEVSDPHEVCILAMLQMQLDAMMAGEPDIAWTSVICPHDLVLDGRGLELRPVEVEGWMALTYSLLVIGAADGTVTPRQLQLVSDFWQMRVRTRYPHVALALHYEVDPVGGAGCPVAGGALDRQVRILRGETVPVIPEEVVPEA